MNIFSMRGFIGLCSIASLHVSRIIADLVAVLEALEVPLVAAANVPTSLRLRIEVDIHRAGHTNAIACARHRLAEVTWKKTRSRNINYQEYD